MTVFGTIPKFHYNLVHSHASEVMISAYTLVTMPRFNQKLYYNLVNNYTSQVIGKKKSDFGNNDKGSK